MPAPTPRAGRTALTAVLILAALTALACGVKPQRADVEGTGPSGAPASTAAPQGPPSAKVGQTITTSGGLGDNRVSYTVAKATRHTAAPDSSLIRPKKGVFVALAVEVRVVSGKTYACYCDFALVAADGSLFEPVLPFGFDDGMQSVTLNSGEKVAGVVVFDVPKDALAGLRAQLRPDLGNDVRGYWTL
ncbi:DUF4352 domain-containing protein [Catellatospora sp. TT07R-123]|uniref:DUF4352 domain-containing protein n=1 Tax=Catellatospora sp. TT07R-123 TaxID=2733863 RepID=UPI001BB411B3|nr:DUF4352 domain-containing protein [Catellatospora sp. TT07R-123]